MCDIFKLCAIIDRQIVHSRTVENSPSKKENTTILERSPYDSYNLRY